MKCNKPRGATDGCCFKSVFVDVMEVPAVCFKASPPGPSSFGFCLFSGVNGGSRTSEGERVSGAVRFLLSCPVVSSLVAITTGPSENEIEQDSIFTPHWQLYNIRL